LLSFFLGAEAPTIWKSSSKEAETFGLGVYFFGGGAIGIVFVLTFALGIETGTFFSSFTSNFLAFAYDATFFGFYSSNSSSTFGYTTASTTYFFFS
jgi:hypothetical protein